MKRFSCSWGRTHRYCSGLTVSSHVGAYFEFDSIVSLYTWWGNKAMQPWQGRHLPLVHAMLMPLRTLSDTFVATWLNRIQTRSITSKCSRTGGNWTCKELYRLPQNPTHEKLGWVECNLRPFRAPDGSGLVQIIPVLTRDGRHYKQLARISTKDGTITHLTKGEFVFLKDVGWNNSQLQKSKGNPNNLTLSHCQQTSLFFWNTWKKIFTFFTNKLSHHSFATRLCPELNLNWSANV